MSVIKDQILAMVERRASKGFNYDESLELFLQLCDQHDGMNLAYALVYEGYATEKQAQRFVADGEVAA